ncbi:MAG TPA: hypothetical protein VIG42_04740 [Solirubrobacteraceae bacterium]
MGVRGLASVVRIVPLGVATVCGALAFCGAPAWGERVHVLLAPQGGFGNFAHGTGVAVDQASGNVYVANRNEEGEGFLRVFGPEGLAPAGGSPSLLRSAHEFFLWGNSDVGIAVDGACGVHGLSGSECASFDPSHGYIYAPNFFTEAIETYRLNLSDEYEYVCEFIGHGGFSGSACEAEPATSPAVRFSELPGVAVDSEGDVFITNSSSGAIYEFNSKDEEVAGGEIADPAVPHPTGVAVDGAGNLYVIDESRKAFMLKRKAGGGFEPAIEIVGGVTSIAVDPIHNRLFIDVGLSVKEYDVSTDTPVFSSEFGLGVIQESEGVAVNDTSGDIYVSDLATRHAYIFGPMLVLPGAKTGGVAGVDAQGAVLEGEANPEAEPVTGCEFEYGLTSSYGSTVPCSSTPGPGNGFVPVTATVELPEPNATYHYRLVVKNAYGAMEGQDHTVVSYKPAPSVNDTTAFASDVTVTGVTLNGAIDPHNVATGYHFAYGTTSAYGSVVPVPDLYTPENNVDDAVVPQGITGLQAGATYHFALVATSAGGTVTGPDETFTTAAVVLPAVDTGPAGGVGVGSATLTGSIDPQGSATAFHFEYGPTTAYGADWPTVDVQAGSFTGAQGMSIVVQNLQPGTTYHYRLVATNAGGTAYGADQAFTTPDYPVSVIQQAPLSSLFAVTRVTGKPKPRKAAKPKKKKAKAKHKKKK